MRMKRFSFLMLALVFIASLAVVGCGGGGTASFQVTNLVINPSTIDAGDQVAISVSVANSGSASGSYPAILTVGGAAVETKNVEIAAGASATVSFDYSPADPGTLAISIGDQSGSLVVTPGAEYWDITYQAVAGSYIVLNYSPAGMTPLYKKISFDETDGISFVMRVYKDVVDGAREVRISKSTWVFPSFAVDDIMYGIDMDLLMPLDEDAIGTLYVQDGIGDVDLSSESTSGHSPVQIDTQGDGTKDPAGSMLIPMTLLGEFDTSAGQEGELPFGLIFTTGHTDNTVHISLNKKMDGATIEGEGAPFAESGGVAPYVGTAGTLDTTGTGDCLGIKLVGVRIDFQTEIKLVLEPAD